MDLGFLALQGTSLSALAAIAAMSLIPPAAYAIWIRNTERFGREPWGWIAKAFVWGAIFGVLIGGLLEVILLVVLLAAVPGLADFLAGHFQEPAAILLALVAAPFGEEGGKGFAVWWNRRAIREPEDGLVYGATVGLGFSATENFLYGVGAYLLGGLEASIVILVARSLSSSLLHASATSLTGYGIARRQLWGPGFSALPYYLAAVGMHAAFNALASLGVVYSETYGDAGFLLVLAGATIFALITISLVRGKIAGHEGRQEWVR